MYGHSGGGSHSKSLLALSIALAMSLLLTEAGLAEPGAASDFGEAVMPSEPERLPETPEPAEPLKERYPPTRIERSRPTTDNQRLDVRRGAFDRQEVRPYRQSPQDRYGKDFPN